MGWKNARFTSLYQHITIVFFSRTSLLFILIQYFSTASAFHPFSIFAIFTTFCWKEKNEKKLSFSNSRNGSWAKHKHASYQFLILFSNKQKCSLKNWMYCFGIMIKMFGAEFEVYSILFRVESTFSYKIRVNFKLWSGLIY